MAPVKLQNAASSKRVLILLKQCDDMLSIAKATTISPNADYGEANLTIATQLLELSTALANVDPRNGGGSRQASQNIMSDLNESRTRWHAIEKLTSAANRLTSSKPTEPEPDGKNFNGVSGSTQATTDQDLEQRIKDPSHPVPVKGLGQTDELVGSRKHELVIGLLMSYLADLAINRKSPPMGLLQGNPPKLTYSVLAEELAPYTDKRIDQTFGASIQHGLSKTTLRKALGRAAQRFSDEHLRE